MVDGAAVAHYSGETHVQTATLASSTLGPQAAKIRAFFVDPGHARQGIGRMILGRCEAEARSFGFQRLELMATLPGIQFYSALGYIADEPREYNLSSDLTIEFVPMSRALRD